MVRGGADGETVFLGEVGTWWRGILKCRDVVGVEGCLDWYCSIMYYGRGSTFHLFRGLSRNYVLQYSIALRLVHLAIISEDKLVLTAVLPVFVSGKDSSSDAKEGDRRAQVDCRLHYVY